MFLSLDIHVHTAHDSTKKIYLFLLVRHEVFVITKRYVYLLKNIISDCQVN